MDKMKKDLPMFELKISEDINNDSEVSFISLVDSPAIEKDFMVFQREEFINPKKYERKDEFIPRCVEYVIGEGKDPDQAVAICNSLWEQHFAGEKISFDYDETLTTSDGQKLAKEKISQGYDVYIISARNHKSDMYDMADKLGIPHSKVYATGSNIEKVNKIKELGIVKHYDNNMDVIKQLGKIGQKFAKSYTDYPQAATENAKTALRWADQNGWGDCGTPVGKIRANQLANREPISEDTISRMASFERHRQNSDRPLGEGCGRLMWLAWGGDEGIAWAQRKLEQIKKEQNYSSKFQIVSEEQHIISGPIMLANVPIYRFNEQMGEHYVFFSPETIKEIAIKYSKKKYNNNVNLMHDPNLIVDGVTLFESFIVDKTRGILPMKGFENVPDGSWFGSFYVENPDVWEHIKNGTFKGFSVEGLFKMEENTMPNEMDDDKDVINLINTLNEIIGQKPKFQK